MLFLRDQAIANVTLDANGVRLVASITVKSAMYRRLAETGVEAGVSGHTCAHDAGVQDRSARLACARQLVEARYMFRRVA
jgi:hypothetical protein